MIPKTIHRILIRNSQIPTEAYEFFVNANSINSEYTQIVWKNDDVIHLMNNVEKHIYESYKLNSHKENFAKYIILKYHGGIVCDLFVEFHHNINELLQNYS